MIPAWNAAFIYDTEAGAAAAEDILEFANSQLLQFRYYDQLLDVELGKLYDELQKERRPYLFKARRYTRAARQVHALFIDIRELLDRTENALKFVGDIYAARVFSLAGARLGLSAGKGPCATGARSTTSTTRRRAVEHRLGRVLERRSSRSWSSS